MSKWAITAKIDPPYCKSFNVCIFQGHLGFLAHVLESIRKDLATKSNSREKLKCFPTVLLYSWSVHVANQNNKINWTFFVKFNWNFHLFFFQYWAIYYFCLVLIGTVSRDFWPFFCLKSFGLGPIWTGENSFANFFAFANIFVKNVCPRSCWLRWHRFKGS